MNIQEYIITDRKELGIAVLSFLLVFILVMGVRNARLHSDSAVTAPQQIRIVLEDRTDLDGLIAMMNETDIQFDEQDLRWSARLLGWRFFRKGSYLLDGSYGYDPLLSKLARGLQDPVPVVILPGIDQKRFAETVSKQIEATETEIYTALTDSAAASEFGFDGQHLFGRMLPETYLLYWTVDPDDLIKRVLSEFDKQVVRVYSDELDSLDLPIDDLLTMASIVEWEARIEDEKPVIAGLYWNRIKRRMYLQADPTVNYALGERRRLLFEDYKVDHPYNTYTNRGLPPGPITNPSLSTIKATLKYDDHSYLYMVANPEGGHVFTRTFSEHQIESEKWRQWLREQYRIKRRLEREQKSSSQAEG